MSRSVLFVFGADGRAVKHSEFSNGWGSAPRVWTSLYHRYQGQLPPATDPKFAFFSDWGALFQHWEKLSLEPWECDALMWTFDGFVVQREDFASLARSLATFDRAHPTEGVSHLRAVGDTLLRILETEPDVAEAAYWHTTISGCPWTVFEPDSEDDRPYDLNRDETHFFHEPAHGKLSAHERDEGTGT